MNFANNDFLFKELVNTFAYTTASQNRDVYTYVRINGRTYAKYGTLQAVTFVGNLYEIKNNNSDGDYNPSKYILMIGMSKQHPNDVKVDKNLGYEIAQNNAQQDPIIIMEVQGKFNKRRFVYLVEHYLDTMKLEFIKTKEEILLEGKNPKNYNR